MNEIDMLRRVRDDVEEATTERLAPARERLLEQAVSARHRPRRHTPLLFAGAAGLALVLASGLVMTNPFSSPPATAVALLHSAADHAQADPAPGPGQYLAVETRDETLGYVPGRQGYLGAYRIASVTTTYVPYDMDSVWVRRSWSERPSVFYGGRAVRGAAADDYALAAHADDPAVDRAAGGQFTNGELGGGSSGLSTADLPALPRDPRQLLDRLERSGGEGSSPQDAAIESASGLLRSGLVPLDLRRALFEALALLPGVHVVEDTVTLGGRTGTAIGVRYGGSEWSVVIDPDSGAYLGDIETQLDPVGAVPAGTISYRTSVTTTVVDGLPSD